MLTENQIKEHLSLAFVHAISARIGSAFEVTSTDMDSVDAKVSLKVTSPGTVFQTAEFHIQLKATVLDPIPTDHISFKLPVKNYNDLAKRCIVPRILVVLALPQEPARWLETDGDQLIMRRGAFWISLANEPQTTNIATCTVHIPRHNVFNCETARQLFERIAKQEPIG
jgi:hypothetical protein